MRTYTLPALVPALLSALLVAFVVALAVPSVHAQSRHPRLLDPGAPSGLPVVQANDNRTRAGTLRGGVLDVDLEVVWADWRVETPEGPGVRVAALAEAGKAASVPAPLLRVEAGTRVRARIRNTFTDSTITVFGWQERPAEAPDSLVVAPGEAGEVSFLAGAPGTYLYHVRVGGPKRFRFGRERDQLAGAFIVDPPGGSPPDRVFVINIWSLRVDTTVLAEGSMEAFTINGRSWPFTERVQPAVGDTLRWRVVNASRRNHPMHLHGFYYDVTARGRVLRDSLYAPRDRRKVVTETMRGRTTMAMEWVATRPGRWLFHCHLSFHVSPEIRLPGADGGGHGPHGVHMAGLVVGIEVADGPTDLVDRGAPRHLTLYVREHGTEALHPYAFTLDPALRPDTTHPAAPGPLLVLRQHQATYVRVENQMTIPTGVHWHGLELDSWADGVPGWSASDGKVSPVIAPGESFTYKLSSMRPGTVIDHSHLDDVHQLTGGLYGPLLVLPEGEAYDPATDHLYVTGWRTPNPRGAGDFELNGRNEPVEQHARLGETHRLRLINIAPAGMLRARMTRDEQPVRLRALAKDGADLPAHQQVEVEAAPPLGVGEVADYTFTPSEPGTYTFVVRYGRAEWRQAWVVAPGAAEE